MSYLEKTKIELPLPLQSTIDLNGILLQVVSCIIDCVVRDSSKKKKNK